MTVVAEPKPKPRGRARASDPVYITREEAHRMLRAATNERDALLMEMLWNTGARVTEVLRAQVGHIDDTGISLQTLKQVKRPESAPKNGVPLPGPNIHVVLHPAFLTRLRAAVVGLPLDAPIIGRLGDGKPMKRWQAWHIVKVAAARSGVYKLKDGQIVAAWTHLYRHGCGVNMVMQRAPITAVQKHLRHADLSSTMVYTQIADPQQEGIIAAVEF